MRIVALFCLVLLLVTAALAFDAPYYEDYADEAEYEGYDVEDEAEILIKRGCSTYTVSRTPGKSCNCNFGGRPISDTRTSCLCQKCV